MIPIPINDSDSSNSASNKEPKMRTMKGDLITANTLRLRKKNRLLTKRTLRVFSRLYLWQIWYWTNAFRGGCDIRSPTVLYKDLSYYGWIMDKNGKCAIAKRVSIKNDKPTIKLLDIHYKKDLPRRLSVLASLLSLLPSLSCFR